MKKTVAASCVLGLLLLTCSKKSTEPDDNNPPVRTPFSIAYTADPAQAASAHVVASVGGSLTALDKDSVAFELTIPPNALPSDTTITITPFSFLRIGGPGGDTCLACPGTDSLCCYRGALFEPSGLVLDSPAVLTVQLPDSMDFPYPHGGLIVYLDSAGKSYQPCFTTYDTAAGWLRAEITHFSGYGTDDERYDRFEEEIYEAGQKLSSDVGTDFFYMDFYPLTTLHRICNYCGYPDLPLNVCYPDLVTAIEKIVYDAYTRHARIIEERSFEQPPCDALGSLYSCFMNLDNFSDFGNYGDFGSINISLRSDYVPLVYKTGNEGHRLCEADSCDEGMELLHCAHEAIRLSWYSHINFDTVFCASVNNWMINCRCGLDVSISADKEVIHRIASSESDVENCIVRLSAGVHNNVTQEPEVGATVDFIAETLSGQSHYGSCVTDADGHCQIIYKGPDYTLWNMLEGNLYVWANVARNSQLYYSDTVSVIVRGLRIALTINYEFHHSLDGIEGYSEEASASITGTQTTPGDIVKSDSGVYEGGYIRTWSCALEDPYHKISSVGRTIGPALIQGPASSIEADSFFTVPGTSVRVRTLTKIYPHLDFLTMPALVEWSGTNNGASYCDTASEPVFGGGYHGWFCIHLGPTPISFVPVNGSCEPFYWTLDTLGNTATKTITVEPVF